MVGFTHTSGSPRAATRIASTSASCTEFTYGIPSRPAVKSWVSSAVPPGSAGPDRRRARGVDHALDLGAQALLHHELRAAHVHVGRRARRRPGAPRSRRRSGRPAPRRGAPAAPSAGRARRAARARQSRSAIASSLEPSSTPSTTSSPRSRARRATCEPMNPVAPVTTTRIGQIRVCWRWQTLEAALAVEAAHGLGHRGQPLGVDLAAARLAGAVGAVGERAPGLLDAPLLLVEEDLGGLVELLVVQLGPEVGGVVVQVGELRVARALGRAPHRGARARSSSRRASRRDSISVRWSGVIPPPRARV